MNEDSFLDSYWEDQYELTQYGWDGYGAVDYAADDDLGYDFDDDWDDYDEDGD